MPFGPLAELAPRNEALQRAKAREDFLKKTQPGFFGRLFGGADDPRLSGDQNAEGRRQAVLQGGFAGLMAAGQGENLFSTVGAIGTAAGAFREKHNEQIGDANLELSPALDLMSQITEIMKDGVMHRVLIDKRTGREIADLGRSEVPKDPRDLRTPIKVRTPSGDIVLAFPDLSNGTLISAATGEILAGSMPVPTEHRLIVGKRADLATGIKYEFLMNPITGEAIDGTERVVGRLAEDGGGGNEEDGRFARAIHRHLDTITRQLSPEGYEPYGILETWAAQQTGLLAVFKSFTKADVQIFNAAAQDILSLVIKSRSGAQASNQEVERLRQFAIPLPRDKPETVRFKLQLMRDIANDIEAGADPFDRVRDDRSADGLRALPFDKEGRMLPGAGGNTLTPSDDPFADLPRNK